ncbi:MAG: hypothetical protein OXH52_08125 [Gammaproteobacteria bacterium]|nr:hypothetical protein [Gammaproteobacteria bacterium]
MGDEVMLIQRRAVRHSMWNAGKCRSHRQGNFLGHRRRSQQAQLPDNVVTVPDAINEACSDHALEDVAGRRSRSSKASLSFLEGKEDFSVGDQIIREDQAGVLCPNAHFSRN